jgi:hypothetical protein
MRRYVVVEIERSHVPGGIAVAREGDNLPVESGGSSSFILLDTFETLEEARAVAEAIAAFKNLPIRTWSL